MSEASRGAGAQASVKATGSDFDPYTRISKSNKYAIFFFSSFWQRGKSRRPPLNSQYLQNLTKSREREYVNFKFPGFLCTAMCGIQREARKTKIISLILKNSDW